MVHDGGLCDLGDDRDLEDAKAISMVIDAAQLVRDRYPTFANKVVREAVTHWWEYPRVPTCHWVNGQYPEALVWTPKAQAAWGEMPGSEDGSRRKGRYRATTKHNGWASPALSLEHLVPLGLLRDRLFDLGPDLGVEELVVEMRTHHQDALLVVMLSSEDKIISKAGHKTTTPKRSEPWRRYEPIGVTRSMCEPVEVGACKCGKPGGEPPEAAQAVEDAD